MREERSVVQREYGDKLIWYSVHQRNCSEKLVRIRPTAPQGCKHNSFKSDTKHNKTFTSLLLQVYL